MNNKKQTISSLEGQLFCFFMLAQEFLKGGVQERSPLLTTAYDSINKTMLTHSTNTTNLAKSS